MSDAEVAYQVVGDGPTDLVYFYGLGGHVELFWDAPRAGPFLRRLASFSRLILFNRRGTGASDGVAGNAFPTWEEWAEDLAAVLDAAGSERAALFATLDAGPIAILFAALHPERVSSVILLTTSARYTAAPDYPFGGSEDDIDAVASMIRRWWGTPHLLRISNPSMGDDVDFLDFGAKWQRASATPRSAAAQMRYIIESLDVRHVLPMIQAPTLVLHVRESILYPLEHGRYLAEHIPGAKLVELPGADTAITPNNYVVADEVEEFLTGHRSAVDVDRVLATVLFSDIVDSTRRAAALGDGRWRLLLDDHDRALRDELRRFRGREIKTTGDGFMAAFDGPARAIRCGVAMTDAAARLGIDVRVGLHAGECEVRDTDLSGMAVHIAARVAAEAGPREVLVSSTVKDLVVGSGIDFTEQGARELKGVPGVWRLFAIAR